MAAKSNKFKKLTPGQIRARKEAAARMKALNAERRSAATTIARATKRAADKTAAKLNRQSNRTVAVQTAKRFDQSEDANFF